MTVGIGLMTDYFSSNNGFYRFFRIWTQQLVQSGNLAKLSSVAFHVADIEPKRFQKLMLQEAAGTRLIPIIVDLVDPVQ